MEFLSIEKTVECIIISLVSAILLCLSSYKVLGVLQAWGYSNRKVLKWTKKKGNLIFERHILLSMCCGLSSIVVSLCFGFVAEWAAVIGLSAYVLFFAVYIQADRKIATRSSATVTNRFKRLFVILFLVYAIAAYLFTATLNAVDYVWGNVLFTIMKYGFLAIMPLLIIPLVCLANLIAKIYEVPHNKKLVKHASEKLKNTNLQVIAITGSYGKTSVKNFLYQMLSKKYRVLATPYSYNTPLGIALTLNNNDLDEYDFLIAEMGARNVGDINALCKICPPDYSVITGICPQHLETFGGMENLIKEKGEILSPTVKLAFIADDAYSFFKNYPVQKQKADCVSDITPLCDGTEFNLTLGENSKRVKTRLLGEHSAKNLAIAAQIAFNLNVDYADIIHVIQTAEFVEHRLQLIKAGEINILDDGYNSNVKGAAAALQVLRSFNGRKIVVTPGLVELGVLEKEENAQLGAKLCGLDLIILVGTTLVLSIKEGYLAAGGDENKLIIKPTLADAQAELKNYLTAGDTVLFLNDLPDIYN